MAGVETRDYQVKKKDCLWNIVKEAGFPAKDWEKIYKAPYNSELRKLRPNPDVIHPKDVVRLPRHTPKDIQDQQKRVDELGKNLKEITKRLENVKKHTDKLKTANEVADRVIKEIDQRMEDLRKHSKEMHKPDPGDPGLGLKFARVYWEHNNLAPLEEDWSRFRDKKATRVKILGKLKKRVVELVKSQKAREKDFAAARKELDQIGKTPY